MIGLEVKQTRCTTCDADHEYKHAKVPRQRRKADSPAALYAQVVGQRAQTRALHYRRRPSVTLSPEGRPRRRPKDPEEVGDASGLGSSRAGGSRRTVGGSTCSGATAKLTGAVEREERTGRRRRVLSIAR